MTIAFDTNVILDAIEDRADSEPSRKLTDAVAAEQIRGVITANTLTDIYYLAKKHIGDESAREAIQVLLDVFDVADVSGDICGEALYLPMKDFEDAVMAICAARAGADFIVTRDVGFSNDEAAPVSRISPEALVKKLKL